jgi:hypothetical protein
VNHSPKILRPSGAVRPQIAAADLAQGFLLLHFFPSNEPLIRTRERDLASLGRPLTEIGIAEEREAGEQTASCLRTDALYDLCGQFLAQQAAAVEHGQHRGTYLLDVIVSERRV